MTPSGLGREESAGFARWLVDPANPLTARVAVNRFWQMYFGTGLVKTVDDFGAQGESPSHPELLDWLATEFMQSGWDMKALQRKIVTSATYRQSSQVTPDLQRRDPENRLLARGPRLRLPAEMIRDQALAASGLLVARIGGPSVKPYQPPRLWKELTGTPTTSRTTAPTCIAAACTRLEADRRAAVDDHVRRLAARDVHACAQRAPTRRCRRWR